MNDADVSGLLASRDPAAIARSIAAAYASNDDCVRMGAIQLVERCANQRIPLDRDLLRPVLAQAMYGDYRQYSAGEIWVAALCAANAACDAYGWDFASFGLGATAADA